MLQPKIISPHAYVAVIEPHSFSLSETIKDQDHIMIQVWSKKFFMHTVILHGNVYGNRYFGAQSR